MGDRRYPILLVASLLAAAHCTVTQMALSVTLSFVAGHSVTVFAIFVGLFLAAMGAGVLVVEHLKGDTTTWLHRLLGLLAVAALTAAPGVPLLMAAHEFLGGGLFVWGLGVATSVALGASAGAFLPIVSCIAENEGWPAARPLTAALTSEYAGAFLGCTLFALVLYPHVGLVHALILSQAITILALNLAAVVLGVVRARPLLMVPLLLALDAWVALSVQASDVVVALLDQLSR